MLVVLQRDAPPDAIERVVALVREMGYEARRLPDQPHPTVGIIGADARIDASRLAALDGVREIVPVSQPFRLASREWQQNSTVVDLPGGVSIGGSAVVVMAGPCSVESEAQVLETAHAVRDAGAVVLRGGAFKPRTSPYAFQGLGITGLEFLAKAREQTGLLVVTEAMDAESVPTVAEYADILQIGSRNMQNYSLLRRAGQSGKPVLLKRGMAATVTELLLSAEYVLAEGNRQVILCERGVRGVEGTVRNLFDLNAIPVVHALSHLPIIADPSHGTGHRDRVAPMARAAVAAGADGLLIEVHPQPERALSDGAQSLTPERFSELMRDVRVIAGAVGRTVAAPEPSVAARA